MNNIKINLIILMGFFMTAISCGEKVIPVSDYLNAGKEIMFDDVKYNLVWSSNPSENYYKQEYLSDKDSLENFKQMILLEAIYGNRQLREIVDSKVAELKKKKESDPMVNFELFEKDGEVMLDFILSGNIPDRKESDLVERNVYRYKTFNDKNGKEGVLLFGVCERAYGYEIDKFLIALKQNRFDLPNEVSSFVIPEITITK